MATLALVLVLSAALLHALWNFLYKRAKDKPSFAWLFGVAAALIYLPVFLILIRSYPVPANGWIWVLLSGLVHSLYFASLGKGYSVGDLSLVYPLARGTGPLLVPIWATALLGERLTASGLAGILAVVCGVYVLHVQELSWSGLLRPLRSVRSRSTQIALVSGVLISIYSIVDKVGVGMVHPVIYTYLFDVVFCLLYGPVVFMTSGIGKVRAEWKANSGSIVAVGFLMVFTYVLVLFAMTLSQVSYVAAAREVSVVFGAAMGTVILREHYGKAKIGGSVLIAIGVALIGMADR